ncbi:MAG: S16 family serine protease [Candidatus Micrarchaeota archaeon]
MNKLGGILFALLFMSAIASALTSLEVPAVDAEGAGVLSAISVTASKGSGDIFMSIKPLTGVDTQHSEKTAVDIAARHANVDTSKLDILFKIESTAEVVDGPSAGAALTLLSFGELSKKSMRNDLTLTGTIERDGKIGKVGGIFEKARAVAESISPKFKVFLIPRGQRTQSGVDIPTYAKEKWDLQVVEVDTIENVLNYAFNTSEGSIVEAKELIIPELKLIPFKPSDESAEFKEIAQGEIQEAKLRLMQSNFSPEIRASLEETLNLSQKQLEKGYYYSAANSAFLASISIDEFAFVNGSKLELRGRLRELNEMASSLNFTAQTEGNFEWVIGAKLRYHWAKGKLLEAEDKIAVGSYISAAGDIAVSTSWLRAAYKMNAVAKGKASGMEMKDIYYRNFASGIIDDASQLENDGMLDNEALDHLQTATQEFQDADYLTAAFDATFATAYSDAYDMLGEGTYQEVIRRLCKTDSFGVDCGVFKDKGLKSMWAELYYAHSLYNFLDSNRTSEIQTLVNGVKLVKLSEGFEKRRTEALAIAANLPAPSEYGNEPGSMPAPSISPSRQLRVQVVAIPQNSSRDLIITSIVALVALLVAYGFLMRKPPEENTAKARLDGKNRMEKAEEMLLQGKISERSFEYFKQKYLKGNGKKRPASSRKRK